MGETMRGEARLVDLGLAPPPLPAPAGFNLPAAGAPLSGACIEVEAPAWVR